MKLKDTSIPLNFYPLVNSVLYLVGEPKNIKLEENQEIDVILVRNRMALICLNTVGFAYVWEDEIKN